MLLKTNPLSPRPHWTIDLPVSGNVTTDRADVQTRNAVIGVCGAQKVALVLFIENFTESYRCVLWDVGVVITV